MAFGTSLPELATALVAALRREADVVIGNLVGSDIFNVLGVLGATALLRPLHVATDGTWVNIAVMLAFSVIVLPFLATRLQIGRVEGAILLGSYLLHVGYIYS